VPRSGIGLNELLGITLRRNWQHHKLCPRGADRRRKSRARRPWTLIGTCRSRWAARPIGGRTVRRTALDLAKRGRDWLARRVRENLSEAHAACSTAKLLAARNCAEHFCQL